MQSTKETAANVAVTAKAGMEKTKATMQEKGEKMTNLDPLQNEMATEKKDERVLEAERDKQQTRLHNAATKQAANIGQGQATTGPGYSTGGTTGAAGLGTGATGRRTGYGTS